MNIHQLSARYNQEQDRILVRINSTEGTEMRLWFTRRLTLALWPAGKPPVILCAGESAPETIYDLASLTKPLCTALLALNLALEERLDWDLPLGEMWGNPVPNIAKRSLPQPAQRPLAA